jgi:hypothetical protein
LYCCFETASRTGFRARSCTGRNRERPLWTQFRGQPVGSVPAAHCSGPPPFRPRLGRGSHLDSLTSDAVVRDAQLLRRPSAGNVRTRIQIIKAGGRVSRFVSPWSRASHCGIVRSEVRRPPWDVHRCFSHAFTGGKGSANFGGQFGPELKYAGFDHVVVTGSADRPVYLWISDGRAEIRDAAFLWERRRSRLRLLLRQNWGIAGSEQRASDRRERSWFGERR